MKRGTEAHTDKAAKRVRFALSPCLRACVPACLLLCSCATDKPETVRERQDRLLADPFSAKLDEKPRDISGGTLGELNRDEMRKDLNSVFNP